MEVFKASEDDVEGSKVWLLPRLVSRAIVGLGKRIKWSDFRGEAASNLHPPPFFHKISIFPPILPRNRFKSTGPWLTNGKQLVFDANVFFSFKKETMIIMTMMTIGLNWPGWGSVWTSCVTINTHFNLPSPTLFKIMTHILHFHFSRGFLF